MSRSKEQHASIEAATLEFPDWSAMDSVRRTVPVADAFELSFQYRAMFPPEIVARWDSQRRTPPDIPFVI